MDTQPQQSEHTQSPDDQNAELAISVQNLCKTFGTQQVLRGVNLDIRKGEVMVILGGSGSGKSTLLRHMIRTFTPNQGSIIMFGKNLCDLEGEDLDQMRKRFGVLFQSGALFNSMTLAENVALPIREHTDLSQDIIDIQVKIKLELVGLREHADKFPAQISGGMKKRAGLARALALDPEIVFYDEPSAGLDPVTSAEIDRLMIDLSKKLGITTVVVTHEMDSAFTIADRMAMLDRGKMLFIEKREWFEHLRDLSHDESLKLPEEKQLVRQFLRGDAEGPITKRKANLGYAEDLLGGTSFESTPSIQPTR
ncbi:MAG: ABC transporter ATP-binding protein [Phycisphaerales bacterium JB043]